MKSVWLISIVIGLSCIHHACHQNQYPDIPSNPTFAEHIAPIIFRSCSPCHRPGGAAPFSLLTYHEILRKKKTIRKVTQSRFMPPWPADITYTHFIGEKGLTSSEIELIKRWVDNGASMGDQKLMTALPEFPANSRIAKPDLTVFLDSIYIPGDNTDRFFVVKIPVALGQDTFVKAIEFVAGKHNLVHHMNGHLLNFEEEKRKNVFSGKRVIDLDTDYEEFLRRFESLELYNDDGSKPERIHSAVNFLPGVEAVIYPEGIGGFVMKRQSAVVVKDIHYGPIPKGKWDRSYLNFFFTDKAPERPVNELMLGTNGVSPIEPPLVIPPNQIKKFITRYKLPGDISILTLNPHMHLLGQSFLAYALTRAGDTIRLIRINQWDFRWQYFYTFPKMVVVPAGSEIVVEAVFDNTADNHLNPNNPPIEVGERLDRGGQGMRTTDEMLQFIITYLPYKAGDEERSLESNH
jgi:hypothetical protein